MSLSLDSHMYADIQHIRILDETTSIHTTEHILSHTQTNIDSSRENKTIRHASLTILIFIC